MADPLSIPNVDPYSNWPNLKRQKKDDPQQKKKPKPDRPPPTNTPETDQSPKPTDEQGSSSEYLGTQIDLEV